jgi:hypothetical protein
MPVRYVGDLDIDIWRVHGQPVSSIPPEHGDVLAWDEDEQQWVPTPLGPQPPRVRAGAISGTAGTAIPTFQIVATGTPDSYAVTPALPAALALNTTTGEITGIPAAAQLATPYQITATNSLGTSNPAILTITIAAAGGGGGVTPPAPGTGSPVANLAPASGSSPVGLTGPFADGELWVGDNTNNVRYFNASSGNWLPLTAGS